MTLADFRRPGRLLAQALVLAGGFVLAAMAGDLPEHPWDLQALRQPPAFETTALGDGLHSILFDVADGRRAWGYLAKPPGPGPFPGVVCVSGFRQEADRSWVFDLARRGYVALVWDHVGKGPEGDPLPNSIVPADPDSAFAAFLSGAKKCNPYQVVAAAIRGVSLLRSLPEVDPERIGMSGLSWGGAMTCIVASLDDRLKCAVSAYGCGGLGGYGIWAWYLRLLPPEAAREWVRLFDPWNYLPWAKCPMLFVNGTNDEYFSMAMHRESFLAVRQPRWLTVRVEFPHGPYYTWPWCQDAPEFLNRWLKGGPAFPEIEQTAFGPQVVQARVRHLPARASVSLVWTRDAGNPVSRKWQSSPASRVNDLVGAWVPTGATAYYLAAEDSGRRVLVTTPHQVAGTVLPARVNAARLPNEESSSLIITGQRGREYSLQFSEDLRAWRPVTHFQLVETTAIVREDEQLALRPRRFYRTVVVP